MSTPRARGRIVWTGTPGSTATAADATPLQNLRRDHAVLKTAFTLFSGWRATYGAARSVHEVTEMWANAVDLAALRVLITRCGSPGAQD